MTSLRQLKRFEARITLFKSLDCPLGLAAAGRNQRFTRYPPVINNNRGWCNYCVEYIKKYTMWKFIVDVVHDFGSSLWPDVGREFLHVSSVFLFLIINIIFLSSANCGILNTNRAYLRKVTGISKPVTLLVSVDQLIDLQLTLNSIWFHELRKIFDETLTHIDSWCKIQPGSNWWAFVNCIAVLYTVVYRVFVEN